MSPKEKAIELIDKYQFILTEKNFAIQCALILVSEMKKQCWDYRDIDIQLSYDYWVQVEQEILTIL
jgi:hypothetical protein